MAKPDNRSDNEVHLQQHIDQTQQNIQEAEAYLNEFADEISEDEKNAIEAKNNRRRNSMQSFIEEKKDEADQQ